MTTLSVPIALPRSEDPAPSPGNLVTTSVLLMAATTIMANATIAPSLPSLRAHFAGVDGIDTLAGLLITLPSLAVVLTAGLMGWLADRFDRQRLLLASGLLYAIGGTSGLWVDGLVAMLVGRLVLGVGVAGMMVLATTWAGDRWVGPARARLLGLQGATMSAGGIVVVLVGGTLASLHWRGAFATYFLVLPIMALALHSLAPSSRSRAVTVRIAPTGSDTIPWSAFAFVGSLGLLFMVVVYVMPTRLPFLLGERGVLSAPDPMRPDDGMAAAKNVKLASLVYRGVHQLFYTYDFGDDWRHSIAIETVRSGEAGTSVHN